MASTAKNASRKVRTYASAVAGVTEKSIFSSLAKCTLKSPRHMPHARIPNTTEQHSFFIDLKSTDASEEEVLAALTLDGIVGAHSRDDLWVVELICESDAVVEAAMNTVFTIEGKKPVEAIWPRHKTNKHSVIKIANVPIGNRQELSEKLSHYWSQYGTVIDAAPYMFPGKPWLTKRWDVLLQLNEGDKKLNAPPVFQIDSYTDTLVCSWSGAKKACLRCKCAGHSTSKCPANKPKNLPNKHIPNTKEEYSFFIDRLSTNASEEEIIAAVNTVGIVGANIRDDLNVIEFVCKDAASAEAAMATTFTVEGKQQFVAILP